MPNKGRHLLTRHKWPHRNFEIAETSESFGTKPRPKFTGQFLPVGAADAEGNQRPHVAEYRFLDRHPQLRRVLMRQHHPQAVFAGFRKNRDEGVRREILKFINMKKNGSRSHPRWQE